METVCVIFYACQCQCERKFCDNLETLNFCDFFVKSCLVLGKLLKSCWRSESFWRLILEPPKMAKVDATAITIRRSGAFFRTVFLHFFFTYFFSEKSKKSVPPSLYADQVRTCCIKKAFHRLALSFVICDFCETRIAYGGVVRPETLRTAPHRRIVMAVALKKNRWDKQKSVP